MYLAEAEVTLGDVLAAAGRPGARESYRRAYSLYQAKGDRISASHLLETIDAVPA